MARTRLSTVLKLTLVALVLLQASLGALGSDKCGVGEYKSTLANGHTCFDCQAGKFQDTPNTTVMTCTDCDKGQYQPDTGGSSCIVCTATRSYQDKVGKTECKVCLAGHVPFENIACFACTAGKFATFAMSSCLSCGPGTYAPASRAESCLPCDSRLTTLDQKDKQVTQGASQCLDVTAPTIIIGDGMVDYFTEIALPFTYPHVVASDNFDANVTVQRLVDVDTSVKGATKVNYRAEDFAGNVAIKSIDVTVTDGTRPIIVLIGPSDHIWPQGLPYVDPMATIEDPREHNLTDRLESDAKATVNAGVAGGYLVTYRMSSPDVQGLYANPVYRVVDVRAGDGSPHLILRGSNFTAVEAGEPYVESGYEAYDISGKNITDRVVVLGYVNSSAPSGTRFLLAYHVKDDAGSKAERSRIVDVLDTVGPELELLGGDNMTHQAGAPFVDPGAKAYDTHDGNLGVKVKGVVPTNVSMVPTTVTLLYSAVDAAGNAAQAKRTVTIVDTLPPSITLVGQATDTLEAGFLYTEPGAYAVDLRDGDVYVTREGAVPRYPVSLPAVVDLVYTAKDRAGNVAQLNRTVTIDDTHPPQLTFASPALVLEASASPVTLPAGFFSAFDDYDGDVSAQVSHNFSALPLSPALTTGVSRTFQLIFSVKDSRGNRATETIDATIQDSIAPVILVADMHWPSTVPFVDPGPSSAEDSYDGNILSAVTSQILSITPGTSAPLQALACPHSSAADFVSPPPLYQPPEPTDAQRDPFNVLLPSGSLITAEYAVADNAGNVGRARRIVTLLDDEAPSVSLMGSPDMVLEYLQDAYVEKGARALDNLDGDISSFICINVAQLSLSDQLLFLTHEAASGRARYRLNATHIFEQLRRGDTSLFDTVGVFDTLDLVSSSRPPGTLFQVNYLAADRAGHVKIADRLILVVDTTAPVVRLKGAATVQIPFGTYYAEPGFTVLDNYDGDLEPFVAVNQTGVDVLQPATYLVQYRVEDRFGNVGAAYRRVVVDAFETPSAAFIVVLRITETLVEAPSPGQLQMEIEAALQGAAFVFVLTRRAESRPGDRFNVAPGASLRSAPGDRRRVTAASVIEFAVRDSTSLQWVSAEALIARLGLTVGVPSGLSVTILSVASALKEDSDGNAGGATGGAAVAGGAAAGAICLLGALLLVWRRQRRRLKPRDAAEASPSQEHPHNFNLVNNPAYLTPKKKGDSIASGSSDDRMYYADIGNPTPFAGAGMAWPHDGSPAARTPKGDTFDSIGSFVLSSLDGRSDAPVYELMNDGIIRFSNSTEPSTAEPTLAHGRALFLPAQASMPGTGHSDDMYVAIPGAQAREHFSKEDSDGSMNIVTYVPLIQREGPESAPLYSAAPMTAQETPQVIVLPHKLTQSEQQQMENGVVYEPLGMRSGEPQTMVLYAVSPSGNSEAREYLAPCEVVGAGSKDRGEKPSESAVYGVPVLALQTAEHQKSLAQAAIIPSAVAGPSTLLAGPSTLLDRSIPARADNDDSASLVTFKLVPMEEHPYAKFKAGGCDAAEDAQKPNAGTTAASISADVRRPLRAAVPVTAQEPAVKSLQAISTSATDDPSIKGVNETEVDAVSASASRRVMMLQGASDVDDVTQQQRDPMVAGLEHDAETHDAYHGPLARSTAEVALQRAGQVGAFLLRQSASAPGIVLSVIAPPGHCEHHVLDIDASTRELVINGKSLPGCYALADALHLLSATNPFIPSQLTTAVVSEARRASSAAAVTALRRGKHTAIDRGADVTNFESHGRISKTKATQRLQEAGVGNGGFVVSKASSTEHVVTVLYRGHISHHSVTRSDNDSYAINEREANDFSSLAAVVDGLRRRALFGLPCPLGVSVPNPARESMDA